MTRSSGILLPVTSLAGLHGIGDLGSGAEEFLDFLSEAGQQVWQVLPLGPAGFGDSPFQSMSAFAGDPLLLSLDHLREEGWLEADELKPLSSLAPGRVDYPTVRSLKFPLLMLAAERFLGGAGGTDRAAFESFCRENEAWLDDFALFSVLRMAQGEKLWTHWDQPIARREPKALAILQARHREGLDQVKFLQFQFFEQWARLRHRAGERGIRIMGDMAIFVSHDSADAWAHPELFFLDDSGNLLFVAGVPPDYFSATGQRWGNPLYRWDRMADQEYSWWVDRMRWTLRSFDLVKIDHFRAFEAYWEIPATETTAQHGRWVRGPGVRLFDTLQRRLGKLPLVVENLGYITAEVEELRLRLGYPGMAVMQFAFGDGADHPFLPHNYEPNLVAYTGTHDNNTVAGWWQEEVLSEPDEKGRSQRDFILQYLHTDGTDTHWACIRALSASVAATVIFPFQDLLGLGSEARMNVPGTCGGNWAWRCHRGDLGRDVSRRLRDLTELYGRCAA